MPADAQPYVAQLFALALQYTSAAQMSGGLFLQHVCTDAL